MLRTSIAFVCLCFAASADAKLGETLPQVIKRFGRSYTIESDAAGKRYRFDSEKFRVDVIVYNNVSVSETYFSDHPLAASGEPPNDIVRGVLSTNVPKARWVEIEAAPFKAGSALEFADHEHIAVLRYTGPQPEGFIWTMTLGLANSVRTLSNSTSPSVNRSVPASTATPASTPFTPSFFSPAASTPRSDFSPSASVRLEDIRAKAERGDRESEYQLGICYYKGDGVAKDFAEAVKWLRKAAEHNDAEAQSDLGACYYNGYGVAKDYVEAIKWFRKAAEQGSYVPAQTMVGLCYRNGQGVPKDYVEAYKWLLLAAARGEEHAKKSISRLEPMMSREQIAEGQQLAHDFRPRKAPPTAGSMSGTAILQTRPESSGTGFFITDDGFLVTNEHVIKDAVQIRLVTSAGLIPARVVKADPANDLALLKAEGKFESLPLATSRAVRLGSTVATVGFPNIGLQGFSPKFARGEISSLSGPQDDARYFQISVPVQPGNSGGALVDEHGNVVGVVSAALSAKAALLMSGALPQNVNYAVKSSFLLGLLESVPEVAAKLKEPNGKDMKFDEVVGEAKEAAVLVLVY